MCRSMVNIQSPTAEIRRGKKKKERKKKERKKQDENIMVCPITYRATIIKQEGICRIQYISAYLATKNILRRGFLWSPYGIGQTIIFSSCFFLSSSSSSFFPRLISAVGDWMFTILLVNTERKKTPSRHHRTTLSGHIFRN